MNQRILNRPFTQEGRAELLAEHLAELDRLLAAPDDSTEYEASNRKLWKIRRSYCDQLPVIRFCLSPFDGLPFDHSIDPYGIDGLWWSSLDFIRPLEYLPLHVVAFTGSMTLEEPIEETVFMVKPGPGIPFVVPWVLGLPGVKAVLCPLKIGPHQGWPVVYFREAGSIYEGGFNTWGADRSRFMVGEEESGWNEWSAGPEDYDFDLEPWVRSGKLLWVPEEDASGVPKAGLDGFKWLGLPGERNLQLVCQGRVMLQEPFAPVEWDDEDHSESDPSGDEEQWWQAAPPEPEWKPEPPEPEPVAANEPEQEPDLPLPSPDPRPAEKPQAVPPVQASVPPVQSGPKFCRQCGRPLKTGAKFCGGCGAKL